MERGGYKYFRAPGILCAYHRMAGRWAEFKGKGQMLKDSIGHAKEFVLHRMARVYSLASSSKFYVLSLNVFK